MRRKHATVALVAAAAIVGMPSGPVQAAESSGFEPATIADAVDPAPIWIVNNHVHAVEVFAVDEHGERHRLGRISNAKVRTFDIPEGAVRADGTVLIKVYPIGPPPGLGSPVASIPGIKTFIPVMDSNESVALWLAPDLTESYTQVIAA